MTGSQQLWRLVAALAVGSGLRLVLIHTRWGKGRGPLQQARQPRQAAGRTAVDPLPFLLGVGIEHELLAVGQHPLGRQPSCGQEEGTAVGAEGRSGPIQQITVVFCGPQLDPPGLGRPVA